MIAGEDGRYRLQNLLPGLAVDLRGLNNGDHDPTRIGCANRSGWLKPRYKTSRLNHLQSGDRCGRIQFARRAPVNAPAALPPNPTNCGSRPGDQN